VDDQLDKEQTQGDLSQDVFRSQMDSAWMNLEGPVDPSKVDVMGVIKQLNQRHDQKVSKAREENRVKLVTERNTYRETQLSTKKQIEEEIKALEDEVELLKTTEREELEKADIDIELNIDDIIQVGQEVVSGLNTEHADLVHDILLADKTDNLDWIPKLLEASEIKGIDLYSSREWIEVEQELGVQEDPYERRREERKGQDRDERITQKSTRGGGRQAPQD